MINLSKIASDMFGAIEWVTSDRGFMECPGKSLHTGKNAKKDCRIITSGAPTIFCLHSSCYGMVEDANKRLRQACAGQEFKKRELTTEEKKAASEAFKKKKIDFDLQTLGATSKEIIFKHYEWPPADMWEESLIRAPEEPLEHWKLFLNLFNENEVVWNGDVTDSGYPLNIDNFRTVSEWRKVIPEGNFTCPAIFKEGSFSRSNENVVQRKFLVIESDVLNHDQICAVFNFCRKFMKLRAVVHTGGKSLHGWFDFPNDSKLEILKQLLPEFGCDPALLKSSQPVRMPGIMRGDKIQTLLYFNP